MRGSRISFFACCELVRDKDQSELRTPTGQSIGLRNPEDMPEALDLRKQMSIPNLTPERSTNHVKH
jgi:hypothetical protein